jgi:hypothetical protein
MFGRSIKLKNHPTPVYASGWHFFDFISLVLGFFLVFIIKEPLALSFTLTISPS